MQQIIKAISRSKLCKIKKVNELISEQFLNKTLRTS